MLDLKTLKEEYVALLEELTNPELISQWGQSKLLCFGGRSSNSSSNCVKERPGVYRR